LGVRVSKHWNPEDDIARVRESKAERSWPEGATAGLLIVAASCVGFAVLLYNIAAPRDVFAP
jgi:hypothetical protein